MAPSKTEFLAEAVLFISPSRRDQADLRRILCCGHRVVPAASCRRALDRLRCRPVGIVLCDHELPDGSWRDVFARMTASENSPPLIVTSRLADERLWAEVLNLGGFDLIAKPFDASEVRRAIETAGLQRNYPSRSTQAAAVSMTSPLPLTAR